MTNPLTRPERGSRWIAICFEPGANEASERDVKVFALREIVRGEVAPFSVKTLISTSARPRPLLTTLREPFEVMSAVAPTNHCDATGALHGTAPAHTPVRTCHATGVTDPASTTADCAATAKRLIPTGEVCIDEVPVLRIRVFGDVNEIAVVRPVVLGGHTDAG